MKVFTLSKRESKRILAKLDETWPFKATPARPKNITVAEIDERRRLLVVGPWMAAQLGDAVVPFLGSDELLKHFSSILVDSGAVRYVCNGADVMRPGILSAEENFERGDIVCVKEQRYQKTIAVGKALLSKNEAVEATRGAIIKNIHYVGDVFWNSAKSMRI